MDQKFCEMSSRETRSSVSASSRSGRCSDDQEASRASSNDSTSMDDSSHHAQSPEVSSNSGQIKVQGTMKSLTERSTETSSNSSENEVQETVKSLTEKLSAALLSISAKEDLVKQHSKVAEEAVSALEVGVATGPARFAQVLRLHIDSSDTKQETTRSTPELAVAQKSQWAPLTSGVMAGAVVLTGMGLMVYLKRAKV